jgi:phosphopantothenoylcysteine decarboxylase / phosphopantothenate---cysteine ligase
MNRRARPSTTLPSRRKLSHSRSMSHQGKKIVLLVSGGIAAYKSADLASRLRKAGAEVRVAMTRAARKFVAPLTFEAISGHPVYDRVFDAPDAYRMDHIGWARWADGVVVAPATADFLARMAQGLADDAPLTLYLAFRGPVWAAPAMNTAMWEHPATRANVETLRARGVRFFEPGAGPLACGEVGEGRMAEPEAIVRALTAAFAPKLEHREVGQLPSPEALRQQPLRGKRVMITAGPTREALDPIRFISNRSTGRMGTALAAVARDLGAEVTLIHGPLAAPVPEGVRSVPAEDSAAMLAAVQGEFPICDVAIFAAAVANYGAGAAQTQKIKGGAELELKLFRTPDIAAWAGAHRNGSGQLVVGFAAESEHLLEAAERKLRDKQLDLIFANPIGVAGVGFEAENNAVTLLTKEGERADSGNRPKAEIAGWIWERILERLGRAG